MRVYVDQKANGYIVQALDNSTESIKVVKECVIEGEVPARLGAAVLAMFKPPKKSRAKKEVSA